MENYSYINGCIVNVLDGLREGLCHFSQPSRAALIYAVRPDDPVRVYDPQNLLEGHEPKLKEIFLDSTVWRDNASDIKEMKVLEKIRDQDYHHPLSGLVSFCGRSALFFFQMWFTEQHPDMCSIGPTERWLEYAARVLARNIATERFLNLGTSGYVLQEYATHAVRDHIVDERNIKMGWDTHLRVFPILDAVLGISKTIEEGAWPRGELVFIEPNALEKIKFLTRFPSPERPKLKNFKHVRKLLQTVENSDRKLISDGKYIIGISSGDMAEAGISVDFKGEYGFLKLDEDLVCSFSDGKFQSTTRKANLVHMEEVLLETSLDPSSRHDLFQLVTQIVHSAGERKFGCTLVIDLSDPPINISGQKLDQPLDLKQECFLDLAKSLAKVDGALYIGADLKLYGFACLLDGQAVPGEDRSRGARFNSALRFTSEHPNLIVVVVSSDRPVSVIQGGVELTAQCEWTPFHGHNIFPPTLAEWLNVAGGRP